MPNWYELPNEQLLNTLKDVWYLKSSKLIGKLIKRGHFYFLTDIRSHEFRKVEYPENTYNKEIEIIFSPEDDSNLNLNSYYEFYFGVRDIEKRIVKNRLQVLFAAKKNHIELTPKPFIERRSKVYTGINIELADTIHKAIKTLTSDINREPETFIYELLQNADDYKDINKRNVSVKFTITPNYLLVTHDGQPFNFQNVYALTGISQGDKRDNIETTGFKGIGFKSIFKDSNFAIVKSGGFEFKFDESCFPKEARRPWQIIPIWVDNYDEELLSNEDFKSSPVSIAIKPTLGNDKLRIIEKSYKKILSKVFQDDRILIFLRWIDKVSFSDSTDKQYEIELNKNKEKWFISTGLTDIEVEESVRNWLNKQISDEDITIPEKYENIQKTKITFAVERTGSKLVGTTDSKVYNYLPTEIDFGFKFLINGDFIPDGSRTELHNNEWNKYLGKIAGKKFVEWLSILGNHSWIHNGKTRYFDRDYLNLIPNFNEPKALSTGKNTFFLETFKEGFKDAIKGSNPFSFIPTKSGTLEILSNTFIDETGLAVLLKDDFFTLTGITTKLIDNEVGESIDKIKALITECEKGAIYNTEDLKADLKTTEFQEWLKIPANNFKLIQHFNSKAELQSLLDTETIILSESQQLHKSSSLFNGIPNELTFLATEKISSELLGLLTESKITLALIEFEPVKFFKNNILAKQVNINATLTDETNLLNFWKFVFDNWTLFENEPTIKDSLKHFEVLCKSKTENEFSKKVISSAYLAGEFNSVNEIESVVKDISPNEVFISDKYIDKKREAEKWRKIFKQAGAITDLQKVIEVLLPKLSTIEVAKHHEIAKQIFRFWREPANKLSDAQINLIKGNLKIKCVDNEFRKSTDCFISDHYQTNKIIDSILKEVELPNEISAQYSNTQITDWNIFFKEIGCNPLEEKQQVLDAKIAFFVSYQDKLKEKHFEILKRVSDLHKAKNENGLKFDFEDSLSQIKLQTSNDEWHFPNNIHLANSYKPKLSLQNDETVNATLHFLNENYFLNKIEKPLLTGMGVNDGFNFKQIIPSIHIDKIKERGFVNELEKIKKYLIRLQEIREITSTDFNGNRVRRYSNESIRSKTTVSNHLLINYPTLLIRPKYVDIFLNFVVKNNKIDILSLESEIKIWDDNVYKHANYITWLIQSNSVIVNQENIFVKPVELFSFKLSNFISTKSELPKVDYSIFTAENGKSLEEILGIKQLLSQEHCIELLCRATNRITFEEIIQLKLLDIISNYQPTSDEKEVLFLLNQNCEWKPIDQLFVSKNEQFLIEPAQHLHDDFYSISNNFGIQELSEDNLVLETEPNTPTINDDVETYFRSKAKFIAFKIDQLNYVAIEADIIEKIAAYEFYEVTSMSKAFPEVNPIYKLELDFYFEEDENKIYYKDNWKTNSELKTFLHKNILLEKMPEHWFENVINRWGEKELIQLLDGEYGNIPFDKDKENINAEIIIWDEYSEDEADYIKSIVNINYNQEGQLDANTTAKIKTLMLIKVDYGSLQISDAGRYLKAGNDEILVRSAQKGLLYIDLFHWEKLNRDNVKIAVYTNNQVTIFNSQADLFQYCQPQNKFGVLRMPDDYTLDDYNSLDNIYEKSKWHFVFIVNKDAKAAKQYKEIMDLDEYNNYG